MTINPRTTGPAALVLSLALALAVPAGAAQAKGRHWTTVTTLAQARLEACKAPSTPGGPWRIRVRVDATGATRVVHGSAEVQKNGELVGQQWRSGRIHPGHISDVGRLRLPRGRTYQLELQIESPSTGVGVLGSARGIHRC